MTPTDLPVVELVERRRLLSVSLSAGTLRVYGTESADEVAFALQRGDASTLRVSVNGAVTKFRAGDVTMIVIGTGGGDDVINLGGLGFKTKIDAGAGDDSVVGGAARDRVSGGDGNDSIRGLGGADTLHAHAGDDVVDGGAGDDLIDGADGSDLLRGRDGHDVVAAGRGNDRLDGGDGNDVLRGDADDDVILCGSGDDHATGDDGHDQLLGGDGNDYLSALNGDDFLNGERGDDTVGGGDGTDRIFGGRGADVFGNLGTDEERKDFRKREGDRVQPFSSDQGAFQGGGTITLQIGNIGTFAPPPVGTISNSGIVAQRVLSGARGATPFAPNPDRPFDTRKAGLGAGAALVNLATAWAALRHR